MLIQTVDHLRRSLRAMEGFGVFGLRWLGLWLCYVVSPVLSRIFPAWEWNLALCRVRICEGDTYTFANIFEDYPVARVRQALQEVEQVIDAGANVGAFSLLASTLADKSGLRPRLIAIEPMEDNLEVLRRQPFAGRLEILAGALGSADGNVSMEKGVNSVTHRAIFTDESGKNLVRMYGLHRLCDRPTLLKMDIEGGEHEVLKAGLPPFILTLFLEWHPKSGKNEMDRPESLLPYGTWTLVSRDLYGSSMWFWEA